MPAEREYKIADLPPGQRGREVVEIGSEGRTGILWLPPEMPPEMHFDILAALRHAYQSGREDMAAERDADTTRERILEKYAPPRPTGDQ